MNLHILPLEIEKEIFSFLPILDKHSINTYYYKETHENVKGGVYKKCAKYVKQLINRDMDFVFRQVIRENFNDWLCQKKVAYNNMVFSNYIYFILYYTQEQEAHRCNDIIIEYLKKANLWKNLHKKKVIKYKYYRQSINT